MNGNAEAVSARQIDPICASPLVSTWGTLRVQIGGTARSPISWGGSQAGHVSGCWQSYAEGNPSRAMTSPLSSTSPVGTNPSRWQNPANQSSSGT
jgi:hypothetical protein